MQRSFSFQAHDDEPGYRALPLLPSDSYSPPKPPLHESTPRYSGDCERQPLTSSAQYTPRYTGYSHGAGHARHDSSSSSSSSSSDSSLTASSATGVGGLDAPRPRSFQNEDMYSNRQQQPAGRMAPRQPVAATGGNIGETSASDEAYPTGDPGENWTLTGPGGMAPAAATGDQYFPSQDHPPADTLYTQAYSPMSQTNVPLIPGTPSSRFADPSPPTPPHAQGRFADPSSPPTPSHTSTSFTQPPPPLHREMGGKARGVLPPPPSHRMGTLPNRSNDRVLNDPVGGHYTDNPYNRYSTTWDPQLSASQVQVNGTTKDAETFVFSDDEEQATYSSRGGGGGYVAAAGTTAAAGGAVSAGRGGRAGKSASSPPRSPGAAAGVGGSALLGSEGGSTLLNEKAPMPSDWLQKQNHSKKKTRWIIGLILLLIIIAAAGGATAGVLVKKKNNNSSSSGATSSSSTAGGGGGGLTESQDIAQNGDLNKNSQEIIALMKNDKLKKVFHGIDYTPLNSQYPDCINNPPTQNNITRDVAVMSLLTDKLRLYGTDCNQTEMVLHAITELDISMKIWLGVWLDSNTTTNSRQLNHLYTLLANYPADRFEGVVVGNEVLFREDLTETQLFSTIADVRHNLTALSIDLPVGTSDLGSNWKSTMVPYVDVLMANVHPFFAGVVAEKAANWTDTFFQQNDVILTNGLTTKPRVMISEVGWPSAGGADGGSVAGIDEMNTFMKDFLCAENAKKTEYFWFSAFDEPWKVKYNEPGKEWEDKWGLMDVDRNLKDGLIIPDCTA